MADIETQISIARPISDVFKAATNYEDKETLKAWQSDVQTVGITAGNPMRTGSMIGMTKRFIGSNVFVNADVMDYQRNKRFELKGVYGRFRFEREIEFIPEGGATKVSDKINVKTGFIWFWYRPFFLNALKSQAAQEWQRLKAQLEK